MSNRLRDRIDTITGVLHVTAGDATSQRMTDVLDEAGFAYRVVEHPAGLDIRPMQSATGRPHGPQFLIGGRVYGAFEIDALVSSSIAS